MRWCQRRTGIHIPISKTNAHMLKMHQLLIRSSMISVHSFRGGRWAGFSWGLSLVGYSFICLSVYFVPVRTGTCVFPMWSYFLIESEGTKRGAELNLLFCLRKPICQTFWPLPHQKLLLLTVTTVTKNSATTSLWTLVKTRVSLSPHSSATTRPPGVVENTVAVVTV